MNRRELVLAGLASLPAVTLAITPVGAQRRRASRRQQAGHATTPARRHQASAKPPRHRRGGGLTASHIRTRILTRSFTSNVPMSIPATGSASGPASPYPSSIQVGGFNQGRILKVRATLIGLSHSVPQEVDVLLVAPGNIGVILMSDAGSSLDVTNITLVFDQDGLGTLPTPLVSGVYQPANYFAAPDPLPPPAPAGVTGHSLTRLNNRNPNGAWQLFVFDEVSGDSGSLAGWSLTIQARVPVRHRHRRRQSRKAGR